MKYTVIVLMLICTSSFGQDRVQKFESLLNALYENGQINGNFLMAEHGKIVYQQSFGLANETTNQKLDENSIFDIASITKQFTAMAIMILHERGKLNLNDPIVKFIPELGFYEGITIQHLLNHTSGLPDYMTMFDEVFDKAKIATNEDVITMLCKQRPDVHFLPNESHEYSNTGYVLLASIIEKVSGKTYDSYLSEAIFEPLEMKNTFVYSRRLAPQKIENYAYGYVFSDSLNNYILPDSIDAYKEVVYLDGVVGDGGINSTVIDLLKWDRALYTSMLISSKGMEEIFSQTMLEDGSQVPYGYGWQMDHHLKYGKIVFHGGGWPGYAAFIARHITDDKTIIILQNHDDITLPLNSIRNILYGKNNSDYGSMNQEQLKMLEGAYEVQPGFILEIQNLGGHLFAKTTGQPTLELTYKKDKEYALEEINADIIFNFDETSAVKSLTFSKGAMSLEAKKIR